MSKVKVLAAIEFAIGTAKLVSFSDLADATINVSELPSLTFEVTQIDSGLQHSLHLQLEGNGSSRASYDHTQLQELVQAKLVEMLRLEDVVKLYGNLKLDPPPPEQYATEYGMQHQFRPHPLEWAAREVVNRLFSEEDQLAWQRATHNEIRHNANGSWSLGLDLGHGLNLEALTGTEKEPRNRFRGRFGADQRDESLYLVKGSLPLGDQVFNFVVSHDNFPIAKHLVFTELAHHIALKLAAEFPFLAIDVKALTKAVKAA